MDRPKQWWIFVETGECVETPTQEEAIQRLQHLNKWATLTPANVISEAEFDARADAGERFGLLPPIEALHAASERF